MSRFARCREAEVGRGSLGLVEQGVERVAKCSETGQGVQRKRAPRVLERRTTCSRRCPSSSLPAGQMRRAGWPSGGRTARPLCFGLEGLSGASSSQPAHNSWIALPFFRPESQFSRPQSPRLPASIIAAFIWVNFSVVAIVRSFSSVLDVSTSYRHR